MARSEPERSPPTVIAHRGFAGVAPENTVGAVRRLEGGSTGATDSVRAAMVEVDVMPTADRTVVCFHDDHLHATGTSRGVTDARGVVWETPDEVVLAADVLGSGETVPRLADVFEALPAGVGINVELKNPGSASIRPDELLDPDVVSQQRRYWDPFVDDVLAVVDRFDGDVLVSSFCEAALAAVRDSDPTIPIGVLTGRSVENCRTVAERYDAEALHPAWELLRAAGPTDSPEPDVVAEAHDAGRDVNVWTVDSWRRADRLRRAGVDGIIADYPGLLDFTTE